MTITQAHILSVTCSGLYSDVLLDGKPIENWEIHPLQFSETDMAK